MGVGSIILSAVLNAPVLLFPLPRPSVGVCMHPEVSIRCSILLCHGACSSLHVLGMVNIYSSKFRTENFAVVETTNLRGSGIAPPPVGRAPRQCRRNTETGQVSLHSHAPEVNCIDAKLREHDVVADMGAVKNFVVPTLRNNSRHLEAYCSNSK